MRCYGRLASHDGKPGAERYDMMRSIGMGYADRNPILMELANEGRIKRLPSPIMISDLKRSNLHIGASRITALGESRLSTSGLRLTCICNGELRCMKLN